MGKKMTSFLLSIILVMAMLFSPRGSVRAEAKSQKVLVVYFSVTGNTKSVAKQIKKATGGTLFRIKPKKAYTSTDIDYGNDNCRASREQSDSSSRPAIKNKVKGMGKYDIVFLAYPIWLAYRNLIQCTQA